MKNLKNNKFLTIRVTKKNVLMFNELSVGSVVVGVGSVVVGVGSGGGRRMKPRRI
jgi:hypothetical protein